MTAEPEIYRLAEHLLNVGQFKTVIDIGSGSGHAISKLVPSERVIGIDHGSNLNALRLHLPNARLIECDLEKGIDASELDLRNSVVICSDVLEHLVNPYALLNSLAQIATRAPFVLVSAQDRIRARGVMDNGPPADPAPVREWSIDEFARMLGASGIHTPLIGHTVSTLHRWKSTLLAVAGIHAEDLTQVPEVSVLAIVSSYNDVDIIETVARHLIEQGVTVHFIDNWSSDGTYELLKNLETEFPQNIAGIERFPDAPNTQHQWAEMLQRKDEIGTASKFDGIIHYDSDEVRVGPWLHVTLAKAIALVDFFGYNAIDHTVIDFRPTRDGFARGTSPADFFTFFEFGRRNGHFVQVKGWKRRPGPVNLTASGGHTADFPGIRVFPLKFLTKHYSLRSTEQARRKIFQERLPRFEEGKKKYGWHTQYDGMIGQQEKTFIWTPDTLIPFNEVQFSTEFLVERLSGIGIDRV